MSNEQQNYPNPSEGQHGSHPQGQYGQAQGQYAQPQQQGWGDPAFGGTGKPKNGLAVVGLVLAILGLVLCWVPVLGVVLALVGLILGIVGLRRVKKHAASNRGVALGAVVVGVLGLIASIVLTALIVWVGVFAANNGGQDLANCLAQAGDDQAAMDLCEQQFNQDFMDAFN